MTKNNFNLTPEEIKLENQCMEIINNRQYVLTNAQYDELKNIAVLYDSLHVLLKSFDTDDTVGHILVLLDRINSNFFEELGKLESKDI